MNIKKCLNRQCHKCRKFWKKKPCKNFPKMVEYLDSLELKEMLKKILKWILNNSISDGECLDMIYQLLQKRGLIDE